MQEEVVRVILQDIPEEVVVVQEARVCQALPMED
jgi:hypothetical protein